MSAPIVIQCTILADGSLQMPGPVDLPPGPAEVVVRSIASPQAGDDVLDVLARIDAERGRWAGYVPRNAAEIDASLRELRQEWDTRQQTLETIQEESRLARERAGSSEAGS